MEEVKKTKLQKLKSFSKAVGAELLDHQYEIMGLAIMGFIAGMIYENEAKLESDRQWAKELHDAYVSCVRNGVDIILYTPGVGLSVNPEQLAALPENAV